MEHKDELFQLIKSLTGNEKRYFKLYSNLQKGDKTYLLLFDALDKLKLYDEKKFKTKNAKASFIDNYTWRKHHLQSMILFSLESFHKSPESEIYSLIHRATILFDKGLYGLCKKTITKAKVLAQKHELQLLLFDVLRLEELVCSKLFDFGGQQLRVDEMNKTLAVVQNQQQYKTAFMKLYKQHLNLGFFRTKNDELKTRKIIGKSIFDADEKAMSLAAKRQVYYARFIYYFMKGDLKNQFASSKKNVDTYLTAPEQVKINTSGFISAINAFLYCCTQLNYTDHLKNYIAFFQQSRVQFKNPNHLTASLVIYSHEITYHNLVRQFDKGLQKTEQLITELDLHRANLAELEVAGYCVNIAMNYFVNERYKESLYWLNKTLNEHHLDVRWDMESMVNIFFIIVHFEKGASPEFLKTLVKRTYRVLLKRKTLHRFETVILSFIKSKLSKAKDEEDIIEKFTLLRKELLRLKKDRMESRPLEYFNLIAWLSAKIEGKKFREIISAIASLRSQ
jgi:hypothetical protein